MAGSNKIGLVGANGFVATNLKRQMTFAAEFTRANIADIGNHELDTLVCAAAPAEMWKANRDPAADWSNISQLMLHLAGSKARRCILISSIAVLDAYDGGYTEGRASFEKHAAYGRHRRWLECLVAEHFDQSLILRLPALFGEGLRKNFVFDMLNPTPSFLSAEDHARVMDAAESRGRQLVENYFRHDKALDLFIFDRHRCEASADISLMNRVFRDCDMEATRFTHADSAFQYYDLSQLAGDIGKALAAGLSSLHLAVEPISAADLHAEIVGRPFSRRTGALRKEDLRSEHATLWGQEGDYLYGRGKVLSALKRFAGASSVQP